MTLNQASIDANRARFDLWAGGETLEAGPTACSMRWRPRKPLVECTCPDLDVTTYAAHAEGVIDTVRGWNPDCLASHRRPANRPVTEDLGPVPPPVAAALTFTGADMEAASAAVRALHAPPVDAALPPNSNGLPWWRRMLGGTS